MGLFTYENTSFSGADIIASVTVPMLTNDPINGAAKISTAPLMIGNLHTLSVSTSREKYPVGALGRRSAKGISAGRRFIAGTLIFTTFDKESLWEVQTKVREYYQRANLQYNQAYGNTAITSLIPRLQSDELPPFDITVTCANEYGHAATAKIYGVSIETNGLVMGINELMIEQEMRYIATDFQPMYPNTVNVIAPPAGRIFA